MTKIIELFAGPGGMSEGMRWAGIPDEDVLGIEWDEAACLTAEAAGHRRLRGDVALLNPRDFGPIEGFHASPPCQGFSMAGLGLGRGDAGLLMKAIEAIGNGKDADRVTAKMRELASDERSALTLEPMRWISDLEPEWVTLEQVPAVLPLWEETARAMRKMGYSVVTANVYAEQYGVPQTRKRAILLASRTRNVQLPTPTHSRYHNRSPQRLGEGVEKWVSMAEALGWGMGRRPTLRSNYGTGGDPAARGERFAVTNGSGEQSERPAEEAPAYTVTGSGCNVGWRWVDREELIHEVEPRVNNQSGTEFDLAWPADRPSPVVAGRDIVTMPGANANRFNGATKSRNDGIRVTVQEAGILQTFPAGYPWRGTKTKQFEQVGNAVPPLLGKVMIEAVR